MSKSTKSGRNPNFTGTEIEVLIEQMEKNRDVLEEKNKNEQIKEKKNRTWATITAAVNAVSKCGRSEYEVKKKRENVNARVKMSKAVQHRDSNSAGGRNQSKRNIEPISVEHKAISPVAMEGIKDEVGSSSNETNREELDEKSSKTVEEMTDNHSSKREIPSALESRRNKAETSSAKRVKKEVAA